MIAAVEPLLTTMGIVLANYDEQRDFLSNFEPFVTDRLCAWPSSQPVKSAEMSESLSKAFSFPPLPINTVDQLLERARKDGFLKRGTDRKSYPNVKELSALSMDLRGDVTDTLAHFAAAKDALIVYAEETFDLEWSSEDADRALEALVAEFGIEMAEARHKRALQENSASNTSDDLSVVHGFARYCLQNDAVTFSYLEEMVRGSMLTNVLYFKDLGQRWAPKIKNLVIYLDTPLALRLLGLSPEEWRLGAEEMMRMLEEMKVPVRVFDHTLAEIYGVLEGVRNNLERARQQALDLNSFRHLNREVIEYLIQQGWGPADVQEIMSDLEGRLNAVKISVESPPPVTRELSLAEGRFEEILLARGFTASQAMMDIKSITGIFRLRKGKPVKTLTNARAIFVTPNVGLVRASTAFFREQGHGGPVGPCTADKSLVTQMWMMLPSSNGNVPRKLLIAECYAALDPPPMVWRKYLEKIEARRNSGSVTEEQVKTLIFSSAAQEEFFDLTRNDPQLVNDETPQQVLKRYEAAIREPAEHETHLTKKELENYRRKSAQLEQQTESRADEIDLQKEKLDAQQTRIGELEEWQAAMKRRRAKRRMIARRASGLLLTCLIISVAVGLLVANVVSGSLGFAIVAFVSIFAAFVTFGWALEKPVRWSWGLIVELGAVLTLFFGIYALAQALS
jgi:hypothetical protein